MSKRQKRPSWFKLFLHRKSLIDAVPDEVAGKALKAGLRYFDTGEVEDLDTLTRIVFDALKPDIDEAFADFQAASEKNRQNIQKRWATQGIPSDTTGNHSLRDDSKYTEADADVEADADGREEEGDMAAAPPRTPYGKFQNVFLSSKEVAELESAIPEWQDLVNRLSVYMESTGKEYKSHYATLISWHEQDNQRIKEHSSTIAPIPGIPTL